MKRRGFLRGATALSLVVAGDRLYRLYGQDMAIPNGAEYEPWRSWREHANDGPLALVRAAVLAANAHNTQPWVFRFTPSRLEVFADVSRNIGAGDPFLREMHLGLGCALENLLLAAAPNGYAAQPTLYPGKLGLWQQQPSNPHKIATVQLTPQKRQVSELYEAIPKRHTNRGPYDPARPLPPELVKEIRDLPQDDAVKIFTFDAEADRKKIIELTLAGSEILRDPAVIAGSRRWAHTSQDELRKYRDGFLALPPDPKSPPVESHASVLASAPLFAMIAVHDRYDQELSVGAGRVLQRLHLFATTKGVALRADNGAVEMVDYQRRMNQPPRASAQLAQFIADPSWQPTLVLYMGYPLAASDSSPRRPVSEVVL